MTPEKQLAGFVAKFAPSNQKLIRALRKAMQKRLPAANELVYDNYNFLVIAYCPTEKPTESLFSLAAGANGVGLAFGYIGTKLKDRHGVLLGAGKLNRFVRLPDVATLQSPAVQDLVDQAVALCKPMAPKGKGKLIIRSISAKQRPRR